MPRPRRLLVLLASLPLTGAACGLAPVATASGDPVLVASNLPTTVAVDVPTTFDATFTDTAAPVTSISWDFGDSTVPSSGAQTSHAWGVAGTYTVTLTATDSLGTQLVQSFDVDVVPAAGTAIVSTEVAPAPAPVTFTATQSRARWSLRHGTVFTLAPSSAAVVTLTFTRVASGSPAPSSHPLATLSTYAAAGRDTLDFDGRISAHRRLGPGSYAVTMVAGAGSAVASAPDMLDFTIAPQKKATKKPRR